MIKKLLMTVALATAALTFLPTDQADAQRGFRRGGGGGGRVAARVVGPRPAFRAAPAFRSRVIVRRPVRYRVLRPIYVAPVAAYSGCEWLRRRALNTGSSYWWRRYRNCRLGY